MGAADVVPGVSGGTIAFITGIYTQLLESIRRITPRLFALWRKEGFKAVWQHVNGTFLCVLLAGILTSIASLAKGISWTLTHHPIPLWSFFFGLIIASALHIAKQLPAPKVRPKTVLAVLLGIGFAYWITIANPLQLTAGPLTVFLAGAIAICAMILPGISGSFILLLLGMYSPILDAVHQTQFGLLGLFAVGAVTGLLTFSHLLSWLLRRYYALTLAFLTGLMLGTLGKIWPWKHTLTWRTNSSGEQVPLVQDNLLPGAYEAIVGHSAQVGLAIVAMIGGFVLVLLLERFSPEQE
ncbi:putative membrane protein [Salinivibrio sp. ES.052]|nr:putative membrane protein [Salinivibrio sp. ES.052]